MNEDEEGVITEWAMIKAALRDSNKAIIASFGHDWDSFTELEKRALAAMGEEDMVYTEYGNVQKIPIGPIQYKARRLEKPDEDLTSRRRLKLHAVKPTTN